MKMGHRMQFVLKATEGTALQFSGFYGSDIVLKQETTVLGRAVKPHEGYRYPSDWVQLSSRHCIIHLQTDQEQCYSVFVEDNSTNGTFINNTKLVRGAVGKKQLQVGDTLVLSIGEGALKYTLQEMSQDVGVKRNSEGLQEKQFQSQSKKPNNRDSVTAHDFQQLVEKFQHENQELRTVNNQQQERITELEKLLKNEQDQCQLIQLQMDEKSQKFKLQTEQSQFQITELEKSLQESQNQYEVLRKENNSLKFEIEQQNKKFQEREEIHKIASRDLKKRVSAVHSETEAALAAVWKRHSKHFVVDADDIQQATELQQQEGDEEEDGQEPSQMCSVGEKQNMGSIAPTERVATVSASHLKMGFGSDVEMKQQQRHSMPVAGTSFVEENNNIDNHNNKNHDQGVFATQAATVIQQQKVPTWPTHNTIDATQHEVMDNQGQEIGVAFAADFTMIPESEQQ